jgi:hypothetical protein
LEATFFRTMAVLRRNRVSLCGGSECAALPRPEMGILLRDGG